MVPLRRRAKQDAAAPFLLFLVLLALATVGLCLAPGSRPAPSLLGGERPRSGVFGFLKIRRAAAGGGAAGPPKLESLSHPNAATGLQCQWLPIDTVESIRLVSPVPLVLMIFILLFKTYSAMLSRRRVSFDVSPDRIVSERARAAQWVTLPVYDKFFYLAVVAYLLECVLSLSKIFCCQIVGVSWAKDVEKVLEFALVTGTAGLRVFVCGFVSIYLVQWELGWSAFRKAICVSLLLAFIIVGSHEFKRFGIKSGPLAADVLLTLIWTYVCLYAWRARRSTRGRFGVWFGTFMGYLILQQILYILADSKVMAWIGPWCGLCRAAADMLYFIAFPGLLYGTLLADSQFWRKWRNIGDRIKGLGRRKDSFLDQMPGVNAEDIRLALIAQVPHLDFTQLSSDGEPIVFAEGSTSRIFRMQYRGKHVAVKSCDLHPYTLEGVLDFSKEAFLYSHLDHPNIVKFYGVCVRPPDFFIVCEYCSHKSLLHVLKSEIRFDWPTRIKFALDAARGMMFAHEQKIMHRDLKTMNLLVHYNEPTREYVVKVCDFGSSRLLGGDFHGVENPHHSMQETTGDSMMTGVVGTIAYMAPELLESLETPSSFSAADVKRTQRKLSYYTNAVDVFSFGYVMWEILTRQLPYDGMKVEQIRQAVMERDLPPLPRHPDRQVQHYASLIGMCWEYDPNERPTFGDLVEELERMLTEARRRPPVVYHTPQLRPNAAAVY